MAISTHTTKGRYHLIVSDAGDAETAAGEIITFLNDNSIDPEFVDYDMSNKLCIFHK